MENLATKINYIPPHTECVILIHGLARTSCCMNKASSILERFGYDIININYPSRKKTVEQLVKDHLLPQIKTTESSSYQQIHFLTHSMGGILLRYYLSHHIIKNLGKTVMLAPPNQGSEVVDKLKSFALFAWLNGPAGSELGTDKNSIPSQLGDIDFETGIITGNKTINPLLSLLIMGPNDGKVSVTRAKVKGMKDFLVLPYSHPFIMQRTEVIYQALFFIQKGFFFNAPAETNK